MKGDDEKRCHSAILTPQSKWKKENEIFFGGEKVTIAKKGHSNKESLFITNSMYRRNHRTYRCFNKSLIEIIPLTKFHQNGTKIAQVGGLP